MSQKLVPTQEMFVFHISLLAKPILYINSVSQHEIIIFILHQLRNREHLMNCSLPIDYIITREKYDDTQCFGMDIPKTNEREQRFHSRDISYLRPLKTEIMYCRWIRF